MKTTEQCPICKKEIPIIEWNEYRQKLFSDIRPTQTITEMVYAIYECPNCKAELNYYKSIGFWR